jgi:hypothetical protein
MAAEPQEIAVSWGFVFSGAVFDSAGGVSVWAICLRARKNEYASDAEAMCCERLTNASPTRNPMQTQSRSNAGFPRSGA